MKILLLNDDFPPRTLNSVSGIVARLARGYGDAGHEVFVLTTHRPSISREILREGNVVSLPADYRISLRSWLSLYRPGMSRMIAAELSRIQPDVVHAHNVHRWLTYNALRLADRCGARVLLTLHDVMSFSCARLTTPRYLDSGGTDAAVRTLDRIKQVGIEWNPLRERCIRCVIAKHVDCVTAVSGALATALDQNGIRGARVIHHGIDPAPADAAAVERFRNAHGLAGRSVILFGGRLSIDKGAIELLKALDCVRHSVPNVLLLIAGDERRWKELVEAAGVGDLSAHWKAIGWVNAPTLAAAYGAADVITTPSLCLDTFNLMNLEAMAAGKPVVGTIFGGTPEIVQDGVTGYVCDPRDTDIYAECLTRTLRDPALTARLGEAGRVRALHEFRMIDRVRDYLDLCATSE